MRLMILACCVYLFLFSGGCDGKRQAMNKRAEVAQESCRRLLRFPDVQEETKRRAQSVLANWQDGKLDPRPHLIFASYNVPSTSFPRIVLTISDEDFDISGMVVKEIFENEDQVRVEEQRFFFESFGGTEKIPFRIRPDKDVRLSEAKNSGAELCISIPAPPDVRVEIQLFDAKGNESEVLPLVHRWGKPEEIPTQSSTPILSAEEAKVVFERIDSGLKFTSLSNEYFGTTDHLYYAGVMKPTSQVTINVGKSENTKKPLTNLYISISALKPLDETIENEITRLVGKYINGFLVEAFPNGEELSKQCALPIDSSSIGKTYEIETATCSIECSTSRGNGNPEYISYLLRITESSFQKELNQRIMGNKMP